MAVIEIENIARHFYVGNETIKALKKIDISIEKNVLKFIHFHFV